MFGGGKDLALQLPLIFLPEATVLPLLLRTAFLPFLLEATVLPLLLPLEATVLTLLLPLEATVLPFPLLTAVLPIALRPTVPKSGYFSFM